MLEEFIPFIREQIETKRQTVSGWHIGKPFYCNKRLEESAAKRSMLSGVPIKQLGNMPIRYNAIQIGFVRGCRPLIGVDGCHLTGEFEGLMLSAIALDADSGIQKCLTNALKQTWPRAGKRHCFRHIIANFNATYKNLIMTGKLCAASRSGDAAKFKAIMESIKEESVQAYNYLMKAKPKRWARHTFDHRIKSDHNTNNMSECFNNWIKED
ncbi:hypothetical protein Dsin_020709 [Dipteronia sinensis]|uniref:Uncharacterized protein n=1 Tax=Dipteronia sinensis TaxID=43782 RepID=A0AAE0AAV9_9ROSI|nr:hypothetical protein Dsin_020433 [Dipteronia sinensis]KAK3206663.1 hypothetical protein Dsin_020709 [Dipteronia sinensis]